MARHGAFPSEFHHQLVGLVSPVGHASKRNSPMRKLFAPTIFIFASIALLPLSACMDTVQQEDIDSYPEPYVPEREEGPT